MSLPSLSLSLCLSLVAGRAALVTGEARNRQSERKLLSLSLSLVHLASQSVAQPKKQEPRATRRLILWQYKPLRREFSCLRSIFSRGKILIETETLDFSEEEELGKAGEREREREREKRTEENRRDRCEAAASPRSLPLAAACELTDHWKVGEERPTKQPLPSSVA